MTTRTELWLDQSGKFETIDLDLLDANPVQPLPRMTDEAVAKLAESMLDSRLIAPIIVVRRRNGRYVIVDGHRRAVAARKHGRKTILCLVVDAKNPEVLFVLLGRGVRAVGSVDWYAIWAEVDERRDEMFETLPTSGRTNIRAMIDIFGLARAIEIGRRGNLDPNSAVGPYMSRWILSLVGLIASYAEAGPLPTRQVGEWVLKHRQSHVINQLVMRSKQDRRKRANRFRARIVADLPYRLLGGKRASRPLIRQVK